VLSRHCQRVPRLFRCYDVLCSSFERSLCTVAHCLSLISGSIIPHCRYEAIDEGRDPYLQQLRQGTKAPALLELRVGAQVL
jgi:hypothetical protein